MRWNAFTPQKMHLDGSTLLLHEEGKPRMSIRFLEEDIIRVSLLPDGDWRLDRTWMITGSGGSMPREGRLRSEPAACPCPAVKWDVQKHTAEASSGKLNINIQINPLLIKYESADGIPLALDWKFSLAEKGSGILHEALEFPREKIYGLGEKSGILDKSRRKFTMRNQNALGYNARRTDPLYLNFPFYICWRPDIQAAYGLLYDNLSTSHFYLNQRFGSFAGRRAFRAEDGDFDLYFILGPTIEGVIEKLTRLTGRPMLPPKYSLGYLAAGMNYLEGADAVEKLDKFLENLHEHEIPCDAFHLASGYSKATDKKRHVFTWDRKRFTEPEKIIDKFHRRGIKVLASIKPALSPAHPQYGALKISKALIRNSKDGEPATALFAGEKASFLDFTSVQAWDWWQANAAGELLAKGVDGLWNDDNEFEVPDGTQCSNYGHPLPGSMLRPVQAMLMAQASCEAQQHARPDERPFTLSRSGCPGLQRYAQTWTGHNTTDWNSLRFNIPMGLGLGLSGMPNYGHAVGGFFGRMPDAELFLRWVQQGIFMPRFCIDSWRVDGSASEPWTYPEVLPQIRDAIHLRYRLIPYLYSLCREMAEAGQPIQRPLVYAFPGDSGCTDESFTYMLGPNLLVATVIRPRVKRWRIYLPEGGRWFDFWSGKTWEGGQRITLPVTLESIPLFVPEGGMIPLGRVMKHVGAGADDLRQVRCFPPERGCSEFRLYEDDGISLDYRKGKYSIVRITMEAGTQEVRVSAQLEVDGFALPYKAIDVLLPQDETRRIVTEGLCRLPGS